VPWLKSENDLGVLTPLQSRLLDRAVELTRPGGTLVYCTCSLEPEEGPQRVEALLRSGAPVDRLPLNPGEIETPSEWVTAEGDLRTLPCHLAEFDGLDGFYAARLVKQG
jgi:16S rRNA (cytosine967-C5)-methyltransferase